MNLKAFLKIFTASLALLASTAGAQILWNMEKLHEVKEKKFQNIISESVRKADSVLTLEPETVTKRHPKAKDFAPNKHYYTNIATYFWPDSGADKPYVQHDGKRNPELDKYDEPKFARLKSNLRSLSIAFYLTESPKYYDAFVEHLKTWFLDEDTFMLPNMEYAQVIPGKNQNKGNFFGIIDGYRFVDILEAVRLVDSVKPIDNGTMERLVSWFMEFSAWLRTSKNGQRVSQERNNQGSSYDVLLLSISLFVGDEATAEKISNEFYEKRLEVSITPNGEQPLELKRTKAFNYSNANLLRILDFCIIQENLGNHFYAAHREQLSSAFKYLWQFVGHKEKFPYEEIGNWKNHESNLKAQTARLRRLDGADLSFVPKGETLETKITYGNLLD